VNRLVDDQEVKNKFSTNLQRMESDISENKLDLLEEFTVEEEEKVEEQM
jgi:hypothetical protein